MRCVAAAVADVAPSPGVEITVMVPFILLTRSLTT